MHKIQYVSHNRLIYMIRPFTRTLFYWRSRMPRRAVPVRLQMRIPCLIVQGGIDIFKLIRPVYVQPAIQMPDVTCHFTLINYFSKHLKKLKDTLKLISYLNSASSIYLKTSIMKPIFLISLFF